MLKKYYKLSILLLFIFIFLLLIIYYNIFFPKNIHLTTKTNIAIEKTTPNTKITFITNYNKCNHTSKITSLIPKSFINFTKESLIKEYPDWNLLSFNSNNIIFCKDIEEFCNSHFLIKANKNNLISIYNINSDGSTSLKENTNINIIFLSDIDIIELSKGKLIFGYNNLNSYLENFEH